MALLGAWHHGEALIAFDPVEVLDGDPFSGIDLDPLEATGFGGGWIGAWGYQLGRLVEQLPPAPHRPRPQPDARIAFYDCVLRLTDGTWWLESLTRDPARDERILAALAEPAPPPLPYELGTFEMTPTPQGHRAAVGAVLEHIAAGDIFQANLCARLEAPFAGDPLDVFCAGVAALHPAYAAFVDSPDGALVSLSPELFLRRTGDEVLSSPIKGTAPLDTDPAELAASAKNRAENIMIVDLMRNDLGRVSVPGSVRVAALNRAERHAVWHLVSDVVGHVAPGVLDSDLLRATFPPGSVTGAPKVRAMQIINELEPTAREAYTGAIGHVSPAAGLELNVAIRTFEIAGGAMWLGVGGGIVADSTPEGEYAECLVKARPLIEAVGGALELVAHVVPPDRSLHLAAPPAPAADVSRGVFDTLLVVDGRAVDPDAHLARLDASVRAVLGSTIRAGLDEAVARRAAALTGRHRLRVDAVPHGDEVVVSIATAPLEATTGSWSLTPRSIGDGWGQHKWVDRSRLHDERGPRHDLLLVADDGSVLETARANLFLVHDDGVHTPPTDGRILPGTARSRVVEILRAASVPVFQRRLTSHDVAASTEVFVTNALRGVVPVESVDGVGTWAPGRTTAWLRHELERLWRGDPSSPPSAPVADPSSQRAKVLFVDNYDSFVYNLVQYVGELGATAQVVRNDEVSVEELVAARRRGDFTHLIVSPGPGRPDDAGISVEAIRRLGPTTPTLGVCLGHQAIAEAYGARVVRAPEIVHGKPSLVHHDGAGLLAGLPTPLVCARYHSLVVDPATLPAELEVTARTASGVVMGLRHRTHPVEGVQMHPESILTSRGHDLLQTFLATGAQRPAGGTSRLRGTGAS
ncbi:aminodeoxychorismate synthase component I [Aeromicrobium wangtongii]|uniref:aminodeoxychorismate synthase component I n=1 Tax=Aeromicrobium wangtongii TaxID=2969247 RepID=UPI00201700A8|nr:aminodeoxychorismate synthase component I [Aeromicrobium wangtongii]MCL3817341.1 aminodeoxychorismate synthase component I [Aeromicrobium wangtongii]